MGTGIITFRNQLWDALIEFLEQLKEYPSFEIMDNGKLKARIEYVHNRALERMRLDKSDMDLISRTFIYLNEKEVPSELVEYMNEKMIREQYAAVKAKHDEAAAKRKAYEDEQNKIMDDFENSQRDLMELEEVLKTLDSQEPAVTEEAKEIVNESVK